MEEMFLTKHHYSWGLMYLQRAKVPARDAQSRNFNLPNAVMEAKYMIERAQKDFVLIPGNLTKKGEALSAPGRPSPALAQFECAIELKPDYGPNYAHFSNNYMSKGDMGKARDVLQNGLSRSLQTKGLLQRLKELDDENA